MDDPFHDVLMTSTRVRVAVVMLAASATLLSLTSCAPVAGPHPTASGVVTTRHHHTPKPTPTPTPTPAALVQPASRYPFGCGDLISNATVASVFTHPMSTVDSSDFSRLNLLSEIPTSEYLNYLGALDCTWSDGSKITGTNQYLELQMMPVTLAEWNKFAVGGADTLTNGVDIECGTDSGSNSCYYEARVNGSRYSLNFINMKPIPPSGKYLPAAIKTIIANINAKLTASTLGPVPAPQDPSVTLPTSGTAMLTEAQTRSALAIPTKYGVDVDCSGTTDGPWEIYNEALQEVDGSTGCEFGLPYNGGSQGAYGLYQFIPAGEWAAKQLEGDTPSETQVADPALPAGDSLYEWTDSDGGLEGDLTIGGNLIEIDLFGPAEVGNPKLAVTLPTAMLNLANDFETTIRS